MFHVALFEPEIPPNTGNIIRLCANTGVQLHLIEPLGFTLEDRALKRAGLDYREYADITVHRDYDAFVAALGANRIFTFSTHGSRHCHDVQYRAGDVLLFGPETRGLPPAIRHAFDEAACLRIPMLGSSRSLNLSNAVAVAVYEAWRQLDFAGSTVL